MERNDARKRVRSLCLLFSGANGNCWIPYFQLEDLLILLVSRQPFNQAWSPDQDLRLYVMHVLENTGSLLLPFVYCMNLSPNLQTWHKLDRIMEAMLTNEVGRKASVLQGSALMRTAAAVFSEIPSLKTMRDTSLSSGAACFHHAPVFGLICGLIGMDSETAQRMYMFITMRDVISAATRLNLVGPLGAAVLQHQIAVVAEDLSKKWMNRSVEEACQTSPLLDTVQGCHSYLFSRLFCS